MTSIQFYVGRQENPRSRLLLACKLTQKALDHNLHVYIHTDSSATSMQLDELLWTWNDLSFIPHEIAPSSDPKVKVQLSHDYEPVDNCDYLINLSNEQPDFFGRFNRMAEILDQTPEILDKGRKRYSFYRDRGYELAYHKL
jgi:DNA polymerase-3 subunit chi